MTTIDRAAIADLSAYVDRALGTAHAWIARRLAYVRRQVAAFRAGAEVSVVGTLGIAYALHSRAAAGAADALVVDR